MKPQTAYLRMTGYESHSIRAASQRARAREIAEMLRQQGFIVPGVQILVNQGPDESQVRYFHPGDKDGADKIVQVLASAAVPYVVTELVQGYPNIRPSQYETWLTANAL